VEIYTIGFAGKTAEQFFESLTRAAVKELVDVRLHNVSQLAGFTKRSDLPFFLDRVAGIAYRHEPLLTPTEDLLKAYRSKQISWADYEDSYRDLIMERDVASKLQPRHFQFPIALLCSEEKPQRCHRRVAAEYLQKAWDRGVNIVHL
jgi:uncharacterized protein (DUF488 family)